MVVMVDGAILTMEDGVFQWAGAGAPVGVGALDGDTLTTDMDGVLLIMDGEVILIMAGITAEAIMAEAGTTTTQDLIHIMQVAGASTMQAAETPTGMLMPMAEMHITTEGMQMQLILHEATAAGTSTT